VSKQYNQALVSALFHATGCKDWTTDDNARLYPLVAAGDKTARETMIAGNMPLVVSKVETFIRCFPHVSHLRDDLVSAGSIGLVNAVNKMGLGKGPRNTDSSAPTDFISMWINRELSQLVEELETTIRLPARSKYRAQAEGQELRAPTVEHEVPERFEAPSYEKELEMRDLIESCCTCQEERSFVAMREAGHTYAEIAGAINKSVGSTHGLAKRLEARVMRKLKALRDE